MNAPEIRPRWISQRRVPRASRACETCRSRKTKCDQAQPCSYCAYHSFDCIYRVSGGRGKARISPSQRKRVTRATSQNHEPQVRPSPWPGNDREKSNSSPSRGTNESSILGNHRDRGSPSISISRETAETRTAHTTNLASTPIQTSTENGNDTVAHSEVGDEASRDGLSGVNLHTNGTEFYGNSSNLAFLGNLYTRAQTQAGSRASDGNEEIEIPAQNTPVNEIFPAKPLSSKAQLSIVNLLYNAEYTGQPSPQSYNSTEGGADRRSSLYADGPRGDSRPVDNASENSLTAVFHQLTDNAQLEIEKIFIGSYFTNKHYIHPVLSKSKFMHRCEQEAWPVSKRANLFRRSFRFSGLYFAVVALGAINASPNETSLLDHYCQQFANPEKSLGRRDSSALGFAKFYFNLAKHSLGDLFESSCLETAQTLLLMSVFRQNSLQPHSCYMYSGMAVRTAAAIGLASSMSSLPPSTRREAKRTWWCIYSHEIEMCCSSGRLNSMKELHYYQVTLPKLKFNTGNLDPDAEENDIAMIPTMVSLAQIMSEASHKLYHSSQGSMSEISTVAMSLDANLQTWKTRIPPFLNLDTNALNDPEWAFKQKLVLRLRYYNTRILIHRPFLVAATANPHEYSEHLHICLEAARQSINMQYESFMHRIYIRTWWYNTTYALYGSMILLYLILSKYPNLPNDELIGDVEKSLEIFSSMDEIIVARRCAEMLREVLDVARACLRRRASALPPSASTPRYRDLNTSTSRGNPGLNLCASELSGSSGLPIPDPTVSVSGTGVGGTDTPLASGALLPGDELENTFLLHLAQDQGQSDVDFFFSLFSQNSARPDRTRAMLANLVDPSILEDFAFGGQDFPFS